MQWNNPKVCSVWSTISELMFILAWWFNHYLYELQKLAIDSIYSDSLNESYFYSVIGILRSGNADMENRQASALICDTISYGTTSHQKRRTSTIRTATIRSRTALYPLGFRSGQTFQAIIAIGSKYTSFRKRKPY